VNEVVQGKEEKTDLASKEKKPVRSKKKKKNPSDGKGG